MVVDTMVVAYALLGVAQFREESIAALATCSTIHAPDSLRAELVNVVWQWVLHRGVSKGIGLDILRDANALVDQYHRSDGLWERALDLAVRAEHPAYDTLFVALAEQRNSRVLTYDKKLLETFPSIALRPDRFLTESA